jgi:hypothetical protein
MSVRHLGSFLTVVALGATALALTPPAPAGATTNSCGMTQYPSKLFSYSGLKVACSSASTPSSSAVTIHDFGNAVWHSGSSRTIKANTTLNSTTITSTTGFLSATAGVPGDIHRFISGPGIPTTPATTFIVSVNTATHTAVLSQKATATATNANLVIENTTSRTITDGVITTASTALKSTAAEFNAADVNQMVYGNGIRPGTKISAFVSATQVTLSQAAACSGTCGTHVSIGDSAATTARVITDGHTTSASPNVTSATAVFSPADTGTGISGPGIPAGAYIKTVTSATAIVLTMNATATSTAAKLVIGAPTVSAPKNGDHVSQFGGELNLNPAFLATSDACNENTPEGFVIAGDWLNPGSFVGTLVPPARTIAQILYTTSQISFPAWVSYDGSLTNPQYTITEPPILLTTIACAGSPSTTTLTFNASASSQETAPGLPTVRAIRDTTGLMPSVPVTGSVVAGSPPVTYNTNCTLTRQSTPAPGNPAFNCGNATVGLAG